MLLQIFSWLPIGDFCVSPVLRATTSLVLSLSLLLTRCLFPHGSYSYLWFDPIFNVWRVWGVVCFYLFIFSLKDIETFIYVLDELYKIVNSKHFQIYWHKAVCNIPIIFNVCSNVSSLIPDIGNLYFLSIFFFLISLANLRFNQYIDILKKPIFSSWFSQLVLLLWFNPGFPLMEYSFCLNTFL